MGEELLPIIWNDYYSFGFVGDNKNCAHKISVQYGVSTAPLWWQWMLFPVACHGAPLHLHFNYNFRERYLNVLPKRNKFQINYFA